MSSIRPWLATVARLILGALFLWSGIARLSNPRAVLRGVLAYELTPNWLGKAVAYGLPVLEICIGVLLVIGLLTRLAVAAAGVLQVIFLIAILTVDARGIKLDCGCFTDGGVSEHGSYYLLVALLNLVLIAVAVALLRWPSESFGLDEFMARGDHVEMPSAKRMRTDQGRRKYESEVAIKAHHAMIRHRYLMIGIVLPVALITFVAIGVQVNRAKTDGVSSAAASFANGVAVGVPSSVEVDVFEDFQSPASLAFEQSAGAELDSLANGGKTQVRYHMVAILDRNSRGNEYSTRAASASICVSDISDKDFLKYHRYLFGNDKGGHPIMPPVGGHGRTDSALISYAQTSLGITGTDLTTFQTCVQSEQYKSFVESSTNNFTNRGYNNVPVVVIDGTRLKTLTGAGLAKAAVGGVPVPQPKTPPTSSATPTSGSPSLVPSSSSPAVSSPAVSSPAVSSTATPTGSSTASGAG